eukprot:408438_1
MYYELNQISMAIFNNNRGKEEINWIEFCKCCLQINKTELLFKQQREEEYPNDREDIVKQFYPSQTYESRKVLCFCGHEMKDALAVKDKDQIDNLRALNEEFPEKIKKFQNRALNKDKYTDYDMSTRCMDCSRILPVVDSKNYYVCDNIKSIQHFEQKPTYMCLYCALAKSPKNRKNKRNLFDDNGKPLTEDEFNAILEDLPRNERLMLAITNLQFSDLCDENGLFVLEDLEKAFEKKIVPNIFNLAYQFLHKDTMKYPKDKFIYLWEQSNDSGLDEFLLLYKNVLKDIDMTIDIFYDKNDDTNTTFLCKKFRSFLPQDVLNEFRTGFQEGLTSERFTLNSDFFNSDLKMLPIAIWFVVKICQLKFEDICDDDGLFHPNTLKWFGQKKFMIKGLPTLSAMINDDTIHFPKDDCVYIWNSLDHEYRTADKTAASFLEVKKILVDANMSVDDFYEENNNQFNMKKIRSKLPQELLEGFKEYEIKMKKDIDEIKNKITEKQVDEINDNINAVETKIEEKETFDEQKIEEKRQLIDEQKIEESQETKIEMEQVEKDKDENLVVNNDAYRLNKIWLDLGGAGVYTKNDKICINRFYEYIVKKYCGDKLLKQMSKQSL